MATHEFGPIDVMLVRSFRRVKHSFHPRHVRLKKCQVKRLPSLSSPIMDVLGYNTKVYETKSVNKFKDFLDFGVRRQLEPKKLLNSIPKSWESYKVRLELRGKPIDDKDPETFPTITLTISDTNQRDSTHNLSINSAGWTALLGHKDHKSFFEAVADFVILEFEVSAGSFTLRKDDEEVLSFRDPTISIDSLSLTPHPLSWISKLGHLDSLSCTEKNFFLIAQLYSIEACLKDPVKYFFEFRYYVNGLHRKLTGSPSLPDEKLESLLSRMQRAFDSIDYLFMQPLVGSQNYDKLPIQKAVESIQNVKAWTATRPYQDAPVKEFLEKDLQDFTEKVWINKEDQAIKSASLARLSSGVCCDARIQKLYGYLVETKFEKLVLQLVSLCSLKDVVQDTHNVNHSLTKTANYSFQLKERKIEFKPESSLGSDFYGYSPVNLTQGQAPELNHYTLVWKEDKILVHHKSDIFSRMFLCDLEAADYLRRNPSQAPQVSIEMEIPPMTDRRPAQRKADYDINISPKGITTCIFEESSLGPTLCHLYLNDPNQKLRWAKLSITSDHSYSGFVTQRWQSVYSSQEGNFVFMARGENKQKGDPLELYCAQFDWNKNKLTMHATQICKLNFGLYNTHFWSERKGKVFSFLVHKSAKAMLVHCMDRQHFTTIGRTTSMMQWINFSRQADEYFFLSRNRTVVGLVVRRRLPHDGTGAFVDNFARLNPAF